MTAIVIARHRHIDIAARVQPSTSSELPADLLHDVETGRITLNRAKRIAADARMVELFNLHAARQRALGRLHLRARQLNLPGIRELIEARMEREKRAFAMELAR